MAGEKCEIELSGDQALVPWSYMFLSYIHAAGLLDRYHVHSTTRINPGWSSDEVILVARFVLVVLLLHQRGVNWKHGPRWVPGVWLGKTEVDDQHAIASPDGIVRGKATRRTSILVVEFGFFLVKENPLQPSGSKFC